MNSFPYARGGGGSQRGRRTVAEEVYANRTMGGNNKYPQQQSSVQIQNPVFLPFQQFIQGRVQVTPQTPTMNHHVANNTMNHHQPSPPIINTTTTNASSSSPRCFQIPTLFPDEQQIVLAQFARDQFSQNGSVVGYENTTKLLDEYCKFMAIKLNKEGLSTLYPPKSIDDMWLSHIVCTTEYFAFCKRYNGGVYIHRQSIPRYESTVKCYIDLFGERPGKFALILFYRHMNSCVQCDTNIWPLYEGEPTASLSSNVLPPRSVSRNEIDTSVSLPVFRHQPPGDIAQEEQLQMAHPLNGSSEEQDLTANKEQDNHTNIVQDKDLSMLVEEDVMNGTAVTLADDTTEEVENSRGVGAHVQFIKQEPNVESRVLVVSEEATAWRLDSGRVAKKSHEGSGWVWAHEFDNSSTWKLVSGRVAKKSSKGWLWAQEESSNKEEIKETTPKLCITAPTFVPSTSMAKLSPASVSAQPFIPKSKSTVEANPSSMSVAAQPFVPKIAATVESDTTSISSSPTKTSHHSLGVKQVESVKNSSFVETGDVIETNDEKKTQDTKDDVRHDPKQTWLITSLMADQLNDKTLSNQGPQNTKEVVDVKEDEKTLESIINARAQYLSVNPSAYCKSRLRDELDLDTPDDLLEVVQELISMGNPGTGYEQDVLLYTTVLDDVKDGKEGEFCASIMSELDTRASSDRCLEDNYKEQTAAGTNERLEMVTKESKPSRKEVRREKKERRRKEKEERKKKSTDQARPRELSAPKTTLADVIIAHAQYLRVVPSAYVASLREDMDVQSIKDLKEVMAECLEVLASMADDTIIVSEQDVMFCSAILGKVLVGKEGEFCSSIVSMVSNSSPRQSMISPTSVDDVQGFERNNPVEFNSTTPVKKSVSTATSLVVQNSVKKNNVTTPTHNKVPVKDVAKSEASPLSPSARSFTPLGLSPTALTFQPSPDVELESGKSANKKAVVVSISAPKKQSTKAQLAVLPGLQYLMGEEDAKKEVLKKKAQKMNSKIVQDGLEEEKALEEAERKRRFQAKKEREAADEQKKISASSSPTKSSVKYPEEDDMPSLDDMMMFLSDSKSMTKEERQKQLDEMFG